MILCAALLLYVWEKNVRVYFKNGELEEAYFHKFCAIEVDTKLSINKLFKVCGKYYVKVKTIYCTYNNMSSTCNVFCG